MRLVAFFISPYLKLPEIYATASILLSHPWRESIGPFLASISLENRFPSVFEDFPLLQAIVNWSSPISNIMQATNYEILEIILRLRCSTTRD